MGRNQIVSGAKTAGTLSWPSCRGADATLRCAVNVPSALPPQLMSTWPRGGAKPWSYENGNIDELDIKI
jgi:hypothetical protein